MRGCRVELVGWGRGECPQHEVEEVQWAGGEKKVRTPLRRLTTQSKRSLTQSPAPGLG